MIVIDRMDPLRDLDAIVAIEEMSFTNPWTRQMFAGEVESSEISRVYVLRTPQEPVAAFCFCWVILDELHINSLAVRPALRRQRLATRLLDFVL
ncbi:MAG: GNAT family N-acetyltransferase, partial [Acidobacteria bacterium]|nr:GNAT family N-acetyltransferase [Acidobacteriota bacterium]